MKTKIQTMMYSVLIATSALLAPMAQAQAGAGPAGERPERPAAGGGQRVDRVELMRERLALTDVQVEQLKPIFAAEREEMQALRKVAGPGSDRAAMRENMQAIRGKYLPQIAAVLTAEQNEKHAKMLARATRQDGPGRPAGPGPGAAAPAPSGEME